MDVIVPLGGLNEIMQEKPLLLGLAHWRGSVKSFASSPPPSSPHSARNLKAVGILQALGRLPAPQPPLQAGAAHIAACTARDAALTTSGGT